MQVSGWKENDLVCIFYLHFIQIISFFFFLQERKEVAMESENEESSPSSVSKPERVACWAEGTEEEN